MKNYMNLLFEKGLPANLDAERFVLGSILLRDAVYLQMAAVLQPDDFSLEKHRRIYARVRDLSERGVCIDRVTLADELDKHGQLESVDGLAYLVSLDDGLPELANLDAYVNIVSDKSTLRKAIFAYQAGIQECLAAADPTPEILDRAERSITALATETRSVTFRTPMEVVNRAGGITAFLDVDRRRGIETPWPGLNRMLVGRGCMPGQMIVIGARPSMGENGSRLPDRGLCSIARNRHGVLHARNARSGHFAPHGSGAGAGGRIEGHPGMGGHPRNQRFERSLR
jgi:replicative DNA helicase